jgi:lambda family phage minor tail protein L
MTVPTTDIQSLSAGSLVEMFVLDTSSLSDNTGASEMFRFHAGTNSLRVPVIWQGESYNPFPIDASGFELTGRGVMPRPRIRVANVTGLIGALCRELDDLVGARLTRKRTFMKYPTADPNVYFPDDIWFVFRKSVENKVMVEFELSSAFDVQGVRLPRRQVIQNVCPWIYRGAECGYAGGPVADANDSPTSDPTQDRCGKRLTSCKLRFGAFSELPFGGYPGTGLIR